MEKVDPQTYYTEVGGISGLMSNYVYSATNVRLQELSVGYSLPAKWFNNKCNLSLSITGHNLWMIYNKAPFDPGSYRFYWYLLSMCCYFRHQV